MASNITHFLYHIFVCDCKIFRSGRNKLPLICLDHFNLFSYEKERESEIKRERVVSCPLSQLEESFPTKRWQYKWASRCLLSLKLPDLQPSRCFNGGANLGSRNFRGAKNDHKWSTSHRLYTFGPAKLAQFSRRSIFEQYRCSRVIFLSSPDLVDHPKHSQGRWLSLVTEALFLLSYFRCLTTITTTIAEVETASAVIAVLIAIELLEWTTIRTSCCLRRPDKESIYDSRSLAVVLIGVSSWGIRGYKMSDTEQECNAHTTGCYIV